MKINELDQLFESLDRGFTKEAFLKLVMGRRGFVDAGAATGEHSLSELRSQLRLSDLTAKLWLMHHIRYLMSCPSYSEFILGHIDEICSWPEESYLRLVENSLPSLVLQNTDLLRKGSIAILATLLSLPPDTSGGFSFLFLRCTLIPTCPRNPSI